MTEYKKIIYKEGIGEITEKKSRFIANVFSIKSEEEALAKIAEMKKKYWDARHNCYAYIVTESEESGEIRRCSDDGEPAQTAGRPMLDVISSENLVNVLVVVTRYFGGVLLGTGGLVRAYQAAVKAGLEASAMAEIRTGYPADITVDYTGLGKVQYAMSERGLAVLDTDYGSDVTIRTIIDPKQKNAVEKLLMDRTAGRIRIEYQDMRTYFYADGQVQYAK